MDPAYTRISEIDPDARKEAIVRSYVETYPTLIDADPTAWRGKFRKMASSPFAFYRGSAALFYRDIRDGDDDPFLDERTSRVWIQGDLHCDNFGTYMNSAGVLVFDVNDFDESYVGAFTWDLKRLAASLALLGYQKALADDAITRMIETVLRSYARQVEAFAAGETERDFALTLATTDGVLRDILGAARLQTRLAMLEEFTTIESFDRRFGGSDGSMQRLDSSTQADVDQAFQAYLETIPESKRDRRLSYRVKDTVGRRGVGIGSAGLPSYNVLMEGHTQALENDIIVYMKRSIPAAPRLAVPDERVRTYFHDDAERTVISQRALQAYADPWLGNTTLHGAGYLVAEASPYTTDLDWDDFNDLDEILQLLTYLGHAVAKVHCVSDEDSDQTLVPFSTDHAIAEVLAGREEEFVSHVVGFGHGYGAVARRDYELFVDAFRNGAIAGL
jgi:uncharacterized protein (DUF2252 family)